MYFAAIYLLFSITFQVFIPGFPKEVLLVQSGILYGLYLGTLINWIGMVAGGQVAYETFRYIAHVAELKSRRIDELRSSDIAERLQRNGNLGLLVLRLIPYAPNDFYSYASGVVKLPRLGYVAVSVVTAFPFALFFAWLGVIGVEYTGNQDLLLAISLILSLVFLVVGIVVAALRRNEYGPKGEN